MLVRDPSAPPDITAGHGSCGFNGKHGCDTSRRAATNRQRGDPAMRVSAPRSFARQLLHAPEVYLHHPAFYLASSEPGASPTAMQEAPVFCPPISETTKVWCCDLCWELGAAGGATARSPGDPQCTVTCDCVPACGARDWVPPEQRGDDGGESGFQTAGVF